MIILNWELLIRAKISLKKGVFRIILHFFVYQEKSQKINKQFEKKRFLFGKKLYNYQNDFFGIFRVNLQLMIRIIQKILEK